LRDGPILRHRLRHEAADLLIGQSDAIWQGRTQTQLIGHRRHNQFISHVVVDHLGVIVDYRVDALNHRVDSVLHCYRYGEAVLVTHDVRDYLSGGVLESPLKPLRREGLLGHGNNVPL